jgi:AcrR family transcriptional regulator
LYYGFFVQEGVMAGDKQIKDEGNRERKRRETLARIAETGLRLFITNGYENTTLEAIAEAVGISRRTFFYYFKSKEEVILAWQSIFTQQIRAAVVAEPSDQPPIEAVKNALLKLTAGYHSDQSIVLDRVIRSSETLMTASHAKYIAQEQAIFEALCEKWPQAKRRKSLRYVAMAAVGALRLAIDAWSNDNGRRPPSVYLRESFANLKSAF